MGSLASQAGKNNFWPLGLCVAASRTLSLLLAGQTEGRVPASLNHSQHPLAHKYRVRRRERERTFVPLLLVTSAVCCCCYYSSGAPGISLLKYKHTRRCGEEASEHAPTHLQYYIYEHALLSLLLLADFAADKCAAQNGQIKKSKCLLFQLCKLERMRWNLQVLATC